MKNEWRKRKARRPTRSWLRFRSISFQFPLQRAEMKWNEHNECPLRSLCLQSRLHSIQFTLNAVNWIVNETGSEWPVPCALLSQSEIDSCCVALPSRSIKRANGNGQQSFTQSEIDFIPLPAFHPAPIQSHFNRFHRASFSPPGHSLHCFTRGTPSAIASVPPPP